MTKVFYSELTGVEVSLLVSFLKEKFQTCYVTVSSKVTYEEKKLISITRYESFAIKNFKNKGIAHYGYVLISHNNCSPKPLKIYQFQDLLNHCP